MNHQLFKNNDCDDEQSQSCHNCTKKELLAQIVDEICLCVYSCVGDNPSRTVVLKVSVVMFLGPDNKLQKINRYISCVMC